jgi:hypothetical protein
VSVKSASSFARVNHADGAETAQRKRGSGRTRDTDIAVGGIVASAPTS